MAKTYFFPVRLKGSGQGVGEIEAGSKEEAEEILAAMRENPHGVFDVLWPTGTPPVTFIASDGVQTEIDGERVEVTEYRLRRDEAEIYGG